MVELTTNEIQELIIVLINQEVLLGTDSVITEAVLNNLMDKLTTLNNLCSEKNNYTIHALG